MESELFSTVNLILLVGLLGLQGRATYPTTCRFLVFVVAVPLGEGSGRRASGLRGLGPSDTLKSLGD